MLQHLYNLVKNFTQPREIIWPPAFNNFTEIGTIHSHSLLYRQNKYINIFREIYFTPSLTAFQVQCSPFDHKKSLEIKIRQYYRIHSRSVSPYGCKSHMPDQMADLICQIRWLIPVDYITHQVYQIYLAHQIWSTQQKGPGITANLRAI